MYKRQYQADTLLRAFPDDVFDGYPPIGELLIESTFHNVTAELEAVAGVLLFGQYVGHDVATDRAISRQAAEAITDYFPNRKVSVRNIGDVPIAAWPSAGSVAVRPGILDRQSFCEDDGYDHTLVLLDSNVYNGAVASTSHSFISTTAKVFSEVNDTPFWKVAVAVGVLASADLHARTIVLPSREYGKVDVSEGEMLLRSVNLNLVVD